MALSPDKIGRLIKLSVTKAVPEMPSKDEDDRDEAPAKDDYEQELEDYMEDLIVAIHADKAGAAARAFKRAFQCLEQHPHEEADHGDDEEGEESDDEDSDGGY